MVIKGKRHKDPRSPHLGAKSNPGMIMTQPGNLKCKKILHVVGDSDPVKINKVVKDALQMCVKSSYTSVSFPAIGTGEICSCMSEVHDMGNLHTIVTSSPNQKRVL